MSKSKRYFYLSVILIIISLCLNTQIPILNQFFSSIFKLILFSSIVNAIILIIAISLADRSIKHLPERKSWIHTAARILPFILLIVIVFHIVSALLTFGLI
ncbi:hypothetical protein [Staphylococcus sp. 11261D007BR]